jgi:hypothetical protein
LQLDGSVFIGDGLTSAPFGFDSTSDGYLAVQNSAGIGGNLTVNGNITAGYSNGGYSISANMIGVQTSLYSYGMICAGNNSGSCNSINGVVIAGSGSNTYGNVYLTGSGNSYFNGGNVGIGTSGPVQKLSVAGEITANEGTWGSGGYSFIQDGSQDTGMFSPSDGVIDFYDNQVHSINISAAGNATFYAGPYTNDWFRVNGSGGIVWQSYGGGWYMQDTTWIRSYGSKPVYMSNGFDSGAASGVNCGGGLGNGYTFDVCGTANVASNLTVAGNLSVSNKITATTFDPVYTIGGTNYATYLPGMTGVKEETAGTLDLQRNSDGSYSFTINFASEPTGGDLWLFAKATDMPGAMSQLVVSLTPSFSGNVWYEKNAALGTLTIHGSAAGEVSYNLTAPRFDASQWTNIGDPNAKGLLVK